MLNITKKEKDQSQYFKGFIYKRKYGKPEDTLCI